MGGERSIPFTDFHRLPGSTPERDNVLERGDLIVAIEVPAKAGRPRLTLPQGARSPVLRVRAGIGSAAVATNGRQISSVRLAMGGVAPQALAAQYG